MISHREWRNLQFPDNVRHSSKRASKPVILRLQDRQSPDWQWDVKPRMMTNHKDVRSHSSKPEGQHSEDRIDFSPHRKHNASFSSHIQRASWYHQVFYSPTAAAQLNCLKSNFKIYIKTAPTCFGVITTIRERTILSCLKLLLLK